MRGHESRQPCVGCDKYKTAMELEMAANTKDFNMIKIVMFCYEFKFKVLQQGLSPAIIIIAQMYIILYQFIKVQQYVYQ